MRTNVATERQVVTRVKNTKMGICSAKNRKKLEFTLKIGGKKENGNFSGKWGKIGMLDAL